MAVKHGQVRFGAESLLWTDYGGSDFDIWWETPSRTKVRLTDPDFVYAGNGSSQGQFSNQIGFNCSLPFSLRSGRFGSGDSEPDLFRFNRAARTTLSHTRTVEARAFADLPRKHQTNAREGQRSSGGRTSKSGLWRTAGTVVGT